MSTDHAESFVCCHLSISIILFSWSSLKNRFWLTTWFWENIFAKSHSSKFTSWVRRVGCVIDRWEKVRRFDHLLAGDSSLISFQYSASEMVWFSLTPHLFFSRSKKWKLLELVPKIKTVTHDVVTSHTPNIINLRYSWNRKTKLLRGDSRQLFLKFRTCLRCDVHFQ